MYFADRWNEQTDWSKSKYVTKTIDGRRNVVYLEKDVSDQHGNRKWNLAKSELREMLGKIERIPDEALVHLPFDQSAGT